MTRLKEFIDYKGVSVAAFEHSIGMSNASFGKSLKTGGSIGMDKLENILIAYPDINPIWLLTGVGSMLSSEKDLPNTPKETPSPKNAKPETRARGIPLIPMNAMAGFSTGDFTVNNYEVDYFWVMPEFKQAEFVIKVQGDSMTPIFNNGDYVICMYTREREVIEWGKPYVVDAQSGAYLKYLEMSDDDQHITLASENPRHKPYKITKPSIRALALVIGVVKCV
jgi:phage repressor protein C with HTH and peptisase S24 domain